MERLKKFNLNKENKNPNQEKQEGVLNIHDENNSENIENIQGQDVIFGLRDPNKIKEDKQKLIRLIEGLKPRKT
jgi:hypothetical protein